MKKEESSIQVIHSISEVHRLLGLPKPAHPLISVINVKDISVPLNKQSVRVAYDFYLVCMKQVVAGKMRYGQNYYDFDEGIMSFISPRQMFSTEVAAPRGWALFIHPDFLQGHALARDIKNYGFFSYAISEALFLSEKEEQLIETLMKNIEQEYSELIDAHSEQIMIAQVALLLSYADRFYTRQFITRKKSNNDLLTRLEALLNEHFNSKKTQEAGLPTVEQLAAQLHVSPHYLSDMLRTTTGRNTQQHIQGRLTEKAKEILSTTNLSVSEIAYQLGFKYPQSFNKLFKSKTNLSPLEYRQSFN